MKYNNCIDKDINDKLFTKKTMILIEYVSRGEHLKDVLIVISNYICLCSVVTTPQRFDEFCRNVDESIVTEDSVLNLCLYLRRNCYTHDVIKELLEQWKVDINEKILRSELL